MARRRSFWGWGYEGEGPDAAEQGALAAALAARFDVPGLEADPPPRLEDLDLPAPRVAPPEALAGLCTADPFERAAHTYGKSYRDVVRGFRGQFEHPPDAVAMPGSEEDVRSVLEWCSDAAVAAIPYGGGSSVVGGVEPAVGDGYAGAISVDLRRLARVLEVDPTSRAARIQAGAYGPALEDQLRPHGLTLRHFPQSFELSTLGGWIATRSGGHYATLHTRIDDFVESLRVVTPRGIVETRRLPASGAGPDPNRLFIGSEGSLGVITEAWVRLQQRPRFRARATVAFETFLEGAGAARALAQSGLYPSNCRLLDPTEAMIAGVGDERRAVLLVGFESADHPLDAWLDRALECCRDHGGQAGERASGERDPGASEAWRRTFLRAPYLRDAMVALGVISETFETAVTWDRFEGFHAGVMEAVARAMDGVGVGAGLVSCRLTHLYPDGPAPYYTVVAPGRRGSELEQWAEIKEAASETILELGGTITHHHAVGRDHRRWYERERSDAFAGALLAAKRELDPDGVLNPGVLVGPTT